MPQVQNVWPTLGLGEYSSHCGDQIFLGSIQRGWVEVALQWAVSAEASPRYVEICAPVDAQNVCTDLAETDEGLSRGEGKVNDGYSEGGQVFTNTLQVGKSKGVVMFG